MNEIELETVLEKGSEYHAVLYTDGGADNVVGGGPFGWGAHGYVYKYSEDDQKVTRAPTSVIPTSGGYVKKTPGNEWRVPIDLVNEFENDPDKMRIDPRVVNPLAYIDWSVSYDYVASNNVAEILAILDSIDKCIDYGIKYILIISDSKYAIQVARSSKEASMAELVATNKANIDLWERAITLWSRITAEDVEVLFHRVPGHAGVFGNEIADRLASIGRNNSRMNSVVQHTKFYSPQNYWTVTRDLHPFMQQGQLFFKNTMNTPNTAGEEYAIINYSKSSKGKDDRELEVGKKAVKVIFGYVRLTKRDEEIHVLKQLYSNLMGNLSIVNTMRLGDLYSNDIFRYLVRFGKSIYNISSRKKRFYITAFSDTDVCHGINPPGLANEAMNSITNLKAILGIYSHHKDKAGIADLIFKDITDMLYERDGKGKLVLRKDIKTDTKDMSTIYEADGFIGKIIMSFGIDTLTRNQFKKLDKREPKVVLIIQKVAAQVIRYYTVVEIGDSKDISIWSSEFSNVVYLKKK